MVVAAGPEEDDKNIPKCLFTVNIPLTGAGGAHVNTVTALIERVWRKLG